MLEKIRQNIFGHFKYLPAETEERAMLCDLIPILIIRRTNRRHCRVV
ncbi:hypothetical protein OZD66_05050 [Wolbachia endosymbiont of Drosophila baimaii]|nr:hypothetical protein [Wolbachia endosymbiont of Drosophila baimaii]MDE5059174.1 hypothetical protein [Wolbachia endosymbiont of Drosophila baimaii]